MICQHKNRIENVQRKGDALIAKVTCQDCGEDVDLFAAWALERAEKAEARVVELEQFVKDFSDFKDCSIIIDGSRFSGMNFCDNKYKFRQVKQEQ